MSTNEEHKKDMGDYFRNIIELIADNIENLERDKIRYGRFFQFVLGINRNLRIRNAQLDHYEDKLKRYIKEGWAV